MVKLSDRNALLLHKYALKNTTAITPEQTKNIRYKYIKHQSDLKNNTWQEFILENYTTYENN